MEAPFLELPLEVRVSIACREGSSASIYRRTGSSRRAYLEELEEEVLETMAGRRHRLNRHILLEKIAKALDEA